MPVRPSPRADLAPAPSRRRLMGAAGLLLAPRLALAAERPLALDIDTDQAPQLAAWAEAVRPRALNWWTLINEALASPGYRPPATITLRFTNFLPDRIAGRAVGEVIELNAPYIAAHPLANFPHFPNFLGHEMVHVVQAYPHPIRWMNEGLADYVRYYVLFPQDRERLFDPRTADFRNGYQPAAFMLDYVERSRGLGSIKRLNAAMRRGDDGEQVLAQIAGRNLDDLWARAMASLDDGSPVPRA